MTAEQATGALEAVERFVDRGASLIELLALAVLLVGVIRATIGLLHARADRAEDFLRLRRGLGVHILLALEILICADIMHTVVRRSLEELVALSAVVVIRTVIAFFLTRELREQAAPLSGVAAKREPTR
ncbi:DUF1622 domain-containing protein [Rubrimonas sp.]|uniref:DUF1622 domain-containing protein n=1 Tax=Rubrimonas sp. TaxID=2036015 RepID=UPI002FDD3221